MFGTRMTDEQVTTLVAELKKRGLCKSKTPKRALLEATDRRITCRKDRGNGFTKRLHGPWYVETNVDAMKTVMEKDLPVVCLIHKTAPGVTSGTLVRQHLMSNDGLLDVEYDITTNGKATMVRVTPYDTDDVMEAIIAQPIEVAISLLGIHPMWDAYIKRRISNKKQ